MPSSNAPVRPAASGACAHAAAVPCPPSSGMLPTNNPSEGAMPNALASATPTPFCATTMSAMTAHSPAT